MHIRTVILTLTCITPLALLADQDSSAIIDFKDLMQETMQHVKATPSNPEKQRRAADALSEAAILQAVSVLKEASSSSEFGPLVEKCKADIQKHFANLENFSTQWVDQIVNNIVNQTVGYLALRSEVAQHKKVIVKFGADWCPPCQIMQPIFERCAKDHDDVRVISIDISQFQVLGIQVENIPMVLFFKDGKEVHRQVGLNNDLLQEISAKHKNIQSEALEKEAIEALEADLRATIEKHLS